jgi:hypothetical protein
MFSLNILLANFTASSALALTCVNGGEPVVDPVLPQQILQLLRLKLRATIAGDRVQHPYVLEQLVEHVDQACGPAFPLVHIEPI